MIERIYGGHAGRNKSSAYKDLVWTVSISADTSLDMAGQTASALSIIEKNLEEMGSAKTHIVTAQVFLADMSAKNEMDAVWCEWLGENPQHWPQRACLGTALEGDALVEVTVMATRV